MANFIESIVSRFPSLKHRLNKGGIERVEKSGLKGKLWINKRYKGFRLLTTSEVATFLNKEIESLCGNPDGEDKGYYYWYLDDYSKVEQIIEFLAKSHR